MKNLCTPAVEQMETWIGTNPMTQADRNKLREMIVTHADGELEKALASPLHERNAV